MIRWFTGFLLLGKKKPLIEIFHKAGLYCLSLLVSEYTIFDCWTLAAAQYN